MHNAWMESSLHLVKVLVRGRLGGENVGVLIGWMTLEEAVQSRLHAVQQFFVRRAKIVHLSYSVLGLKKVLNRASSRYCIQLNMDDMPSRMWYTQAYSFAHRAALVSHFRNRTLYAESTPLMDAFIDRAHSTVEERARGRNYTALLNHCTEYIEGTMELVDSETALDFNDIPDVIRTSTRTVERGWVKQLLMARQSDIASRESITIEETHQEFKSEEKVTTFCAHDSIVLNGMFTTSDRFEVPDEEREHDVPIHGTSVTVIAAPDYGDLCCGIDEDESPIQLPFYYYGMATVKDADPRTYFIITGLGHQADDADADSPLRDWSRHLPSQYTYRNKSGYRVTRELHPVSSTRQMSRRCASAYH
jgi:hypothetical protein